MIYYIADTHFGHANIIKLCDRPFKNVREMDIDMAVAIQELDKEENIIAHVGDLTFNIGDFYKQFGELKYPENNIMIMGNHDHLKTPQQISQARSWFGTIVGLRKTWQLNSWIINDGPHKVMLSHVPQRDLRGCDYNVYGHFHNNLIRRNPMDKDWFWVLEDARYLNAGVEITDYEPLALDELIYVNRAY